MNVLYVYATLRQRNGVTAVVMNYLRHLPKDGLHVDLLVHSDSEPAMVDLARSLGAEVFFMPKLGLKSFRRFTSFLRGFFAGRPYDIVHSHFNQVDAFLFPAARAHGVRHCISHSHNTKLSDYPLRALRNRLLCWNIARNADTLAACSEAAGIALFGPSFASSPKKLIVRNGVDVAKFAFNPAAREKIRREFRVGPDEILLGHVGSFRPQKNHAFLLRLFDRLCKESARYKLLMAGDGPRLEEMRRMASELHLADKTLFAGSRTDVSDLFSAMDLFLLPSFYEGLPVTGIEAQASGLECLFADTVTREADLTGVTFLPLGPDPQNWISAIRSAPARRHPEFAGLVSGAGYDIGAEAMKLAAFYRGHAPGTEVRHGG